MQLLLILALLLYGGKPEGRNMLNEIRPMLESLGGEELKEAMKSAEEITEAITAVQAFAGSLGSSVSPSVSENTSSNSAAGRQEPAIAFPLSPISDIADRDITYSLSKYISQNQLN